MRIESNYCQSHESTELVKGYVVEGQVGHTIGLVFKCCNELTIAQLAEHRVAGCCEFDSQTGKALLCPRETRLTLISHWGQIVYPLRWPQPDKKLANRTQKKSA